MEEQMIHIPPSLQVGDTIGMVCPAGYMAPDRMQDCIQTLETWGLKVKKGATLNSASQNYFSGTDAERKADLQLMLDDPQVRAVLFGRGGYGMGRIIDELDFSGFNQSPKWLVGFSDVTVILSHLLHNFNTASIHGPMAAAFMGNGAQSFSIHSLKNALFSPTYEYEMQPAPFNNNGTAAGILTGGNLALLVNIIGTPSDVDWSGKILFLEDVGEYLYSIDRMMLQLRRSGKLSQLAGIIVGGFTDMKDTIRPFGEEVNEIIHRYVQQLSIPVCFNFPVSHGEHNLALKCGVKHFFEVSDQKTVLKVMD